MAGQKLLIYSSAEGHVVCCFYNSLELLRNNVAWAWWPTFNPRGTVVHTLDPRGMVAHTFNTRGMVAYTFNPRDMVAHTFNPRGTVVHTFNPSTPEAERGKSRGQPGLHSELQDNQSYTERPNLKKKVNKYLINKVTIKVHVQVFVCVYVLFS